MVYASFQVQQTNMYVSMILLSHHAWLLQRDVRIVIYFLVIVPVDTYSAHLNSHCTSTDREEAFHSKR